MGDIRDAKDEILSLGDNDFLLADNGSNKKIRKSSLTDTLGINELGTGKVSWTDVANVLTTTTAGKVLDARQGKALKDLIDAIIASEGVADGIATLGSDGKIPAAQIPSLALVDVYTVASEAEMLACGAEQGDMAIRTDENMIYILATAPATTLGNWVELTVLQDLIQSYIDDLAGAERTTETVYGNAVAIAEEAAARADADTAIQTSLDSANIEIAQLREENNNLKHSLDTANALNSETGEETGNGAVSLPYNALNGRLGLTFGGRTLKPLGTNMDFSDGTTGWSAVSCSLSVTDKILTITPSGSFARANQDILSVDSDIYGSVRMRAKGTITEMGLRDDSGTKIANIESPVVDQWYILYGLITVVNSIFRIYVGGGIGVDVEVDGNYGVRVFNLTNFYSSTALATITAEKILRTTPYYFEGLKSVKGYGRFRFVNANLAPTSMDEWEIGLISTTTGEDSVSDNYLRMKNFKRIAPSTEVEKSSASGYRFITLVFYDAEFSFIGYSNDNTQTTPNNAQYYRGVVRFDPIAPITAGEIVNGQPMLNLGSTALDYIPHEHNDVFYKSGDDFLSVPSIEDKLVYINGAWKHEHNVGVINLSDYTPNSFDVVGDIPVLRSDNPFDTIIGATAFEDALQSTVYMESKVQKTFDAILTYLVENCFMTSAGTYARLRVSFSIGMTEQQCIDEWNILQFYYQLAEPYYTDIEVSGIPTAYANGSVYNDPVVPDAGVYDSGITILNSDYPIESFERISVYSNGVFTDVDISTAVIAGDGLSFTHPDLSKDDIVTFDYRYAQASPMGGVTAEYYNSAVILKDTVTGALYRKVDTVASGVLTTTLEAV